MAFSTHQIMLLAARRSVHSDSKILGKGEGEKEKERRRRREGEGEKERRREGEKERRREREKQRKREETDLPPQRRFCRQIQGAAQHRRQLASSGTAPSP
jgi:hypothetical protein